MKKILSFLLILILCFYSETVYAKYITDENGNIVLSNDSYDDKGKIKLAPTWYEKNEKILNAEIYKIDWAIPKVKFIGLDEKSVEGTLTYPNYNEMVIGTFDLQWLFTPNDPKYETKSGVYHFYLYSPDTEEQKGKISAVDETIEVPTTPSLTATTVQLDTTTTYDVNINNKPSESVTYSWTSSDTNVVDVNPKSGLLKAKSEGKATVTCEITFPDTTTQTLTSEVAVGYDENAPVLSDTALDLTIGEKFDIDAENCVAKSKIKYVSSDKTVATVKSSTGVIKAVGAGIAYVTCTITTPDKQVIVLRCDINVTEPEVITE